MRTPLIVLAVLCLLPAWASADRTYTPAPLVLDRIAASISECLWIEAVTQNDLSVEIVGKTHTYKIAKAFRKNLSDDAFFSEVKFGRVYEVPGGITYTLMFRVERESERVAEKKVLYKSSVGFREFSEQRGDRCP